MAIKIGIIGYGNIAATYHGKVISESPDRFELTSVMDTTPARLGAARELPGVMAFDTLEEFLAGGIDLVIVATPTKFHAEYALAAVKAGKHVVMEKPMAKSYAEIVPLLKAANEKNVLLTVHHNRRWDSGFQTVKRIIDEGTIGDVIVVQSKANGIGAPVKAGTPDYYPEWRLEESYGGGKLNEWGSHLIDQALQIFGYDIEYVWGHLAEVGLSKEVDTYGKYVIKFSSGVLFQIETSWISPIPEPRWYALGTGGALTKNTMDPDEPVTVIQNEAPNQTESEVVCIESSHRQFYDDLYNALTQKRKPAVAPEEGAMVVRVIEAVRESSKSGHVVRFGD